MTKNLLNRSQRLVPPKSNSSSGSERAASVDVNKNKKKMSGLDA